MGDEMNTYRIFVEDEQVASCHVLGDALDYVKWFISNEPYLDEDRFVYIATNTEELLKVNLKHH
jgi:hypothetical protein